MHLPPLELETVLSPKKVVFVLRTQTILKHIVPQVRDHLGIENQQGADVNLDLRDDGDIVFTVSKHAP